MLNPLDTALFNYYNSDGKNITEFVLEEQTILSLTKPREKEGQRGYSFEVKAKLKYGLFTDITDSDRHQWIWGTPVR